MKIFCKFPTVNTIEVKSLHPPFRIYCVVHSCCFCCCCLFSDVVHESLVCLEQLNCLLFFRKILQVPQILWFSFSYVKQWLFLTMTVWFWDPSFHTEDNWGQGLICNYYRRFKRSLMLQKEKPCILQILKGGCKLLISTVYQNLIFD